MPDDTKFCTSRPAVRSAPIGPFGNHRSDPFVSQAFVMTYRTTRSIDSTAVVLSAM
jgi:hypothetical protein